jgi:hypothetical protein
MVCQPCGLTMEADFDVPALAQLSAEDQLFVVAFVRHHGSIKKMEGLFDVSYPTIKNRLNAIGQRLDRSFEAPSSNLGVLELLESGQITVEQALERIL